MNRRLWLIGSMVLASLGLLAASGAAVALANGGNSIAAAPTVVYGQQEFGNTAEGQHLENSCGFLDGAWRSYWQLPVLAGDRLTINWEGTPGTRLVLMAVGTTDFTYFNTDPAFYQDLSSNGKAQAQYTAPVSGNLPLSFRVCEFHGEEPGPYDFMAADQHALVVALPPTNYIYRQSAISGSAHLADGSPVPDGLIFNLVAKWHSGGQLLGAATSAAAVGGGLSFQLSLPSETAGKVVRLSISRPEDSSYQAARSTPANVQVVRPRHAHRHHRHHRRHHH